ncbi:hypothetical protein IFM89_019953 [Coptis chinensis]|uniref:Uncharacterized protein n=1 Tax=Coptis chinensis TaxID=261450 RepID=A0A835HEC9_9MAGN|nr:hypothetical protein IFM89_019953 [Coptis chinensis]
MDVIDDILTKQHGAFVNLAKRGNLPGAENLVVQRFQGLFSQTKYKEAAELAAKSPQGLLRTLDSCNVSGHESLDMPRFQGSELPKVRESCLRLATTLTCCWLAGILGRRDAVESGMNTGWPFCVVRPGDVCRRSRENLQLLIQMIRALSVCGE